MASVSIDRDGISITICGNYEKITVEDFTVLIQDALKSFSGYHFTVDKD